MEVTIALLENAMKEAMETSKSTRFLIDGFPRKMDQAIKFEEVVRIITAIIILLRWEGNKSLLDNAAHVLWRGIRNDGRRQKTGIRADKSFTQNI